MTTHALSRPIGVQCPSWCASEHPAALYLNPTSVRALTRHEPSDRVPGGGPWEVGSVVHGCTLAAGDDGLTVALELLESHPALGFDESDPGRSVILWGPSLDGWPDSEGPLELPWTSDTASMLRAWGRVLDEAADALDAMGCGQ